MPSREVTRKEDGVKGRFHSIRGEQRFIPNDPANSPAAGVGMAEAALIGFGETIENTGTRFEAAKDTLTGKENTPAQQEMADIQRLLDPLEEERPFATAIGQSVPGFMLPSAKAAQTVAGVAEGMLSDPENPILGGLIGGAGGFIGGAIGQKLGNLVQKRATGAAARLAARGVPTTLFQRTNNPVEKSIEGGLQAVPVVSAWASAPLRAQQRALNSGVKGAFGYEGTLNPKGLGEIKRALGAQFDEVQSYIPDQQMDAALVDRLDELGALDDATKELMQGYGLVDGEGLMAIRSTLNEDMSDAFINANRKEGRRLRAALNEVDDLINTTLPAEMAEQWASARNQWQFLTAITKGKAVSTAGEVNLASMMSALKSIYPNFRVGKDLPGAPKGFGQLITALDELPKMLQSSGTAERAAAGEAIKGNLTLQGLIGGVPLAARAAGQPGVDAGATIGIGAAGGSDLESYIDSLITEPE